MASSVYLDRNNFLSTAYGAGTCACNYPIYQDAWVGSGVTITTTQGEKLITLTAGSEDFSALLQGEQGVLRYPFIVNYNENFLIEIDYVINSTTAMLKQPFYHTTTTGTDWIILDTWAEPVLASTTIGNSDTIQNNFVFATASTNSDVSSIAAGQKLNFGTTPVMVFMEGLNLFMVLKFN